MNKIRKLMAKKGFTLVELIVVIAIIGVLAAILVPSMMGYVKSSNITSADQTAGNIKTAMGTVITNLDSKGGSLVTSSFDVVFQITNPSGSAPTFTATVQGLAAGVTNCMKGNNAAGVAYTSTDFADALTEKLEADLKEVKAGTARAFIENGVVVQVVYSSDSGTVTGLGGKVTADTWSATGNEEGIIGGTILGTNPKVYKS